MRIKINLRFLITIAITFVSANNIQASTLHSFKKIMLVVAMSAEAKPIIAAFKLKPVASPNKLPMLFYQGRYHDKEILLVQNGQDKIDHAENIGTEAATLATYVGSESFHPNLIISIGSAGGVKENNAHPNDIYVSNIINFYGRRLPLAGYKEYGIGAFESFTIPNTKTLSLKQGVVCSGDSFDQDATDYHNFLALHCNVIDMEAAGVAWVSKLIETPMFAMKGVTNYVSGNRIHEDYKRNLPAITARLASTLKSLLATL